MGDLSNMFNPVGGGFGGDMSSTGPVSTRSGGIASQNYYFGGNPNVASALQNPWIVGGIAVVAIIGLAVYARK